MIEQVSTFDDEVLRIRVAREVEFAQIIERRTREYQEEGLVYPDIDPSLAAHALGGMVAGLSLIHIWNKREETARVLIDGSYWTGDLGRVDGEGNLYIVDRRKDMIITGGENVYGVEVEDALTSHPAVFEAAVIGTPDERWGELVVGIVVVADDVSLDELDRHCRARLAAYKIPRRYVLRSEPLPRSAAGKLLKRELREELGELQDSYPTQG